MHKCHIQRLYRALRVVDEKIGRAQTPAEAEENWSELKRIERDAAGLPLRHSNLFFELKTQIVAAIARFEGAKATLS